jgi:hypothetical protein
MTAFCRKIEHALRQFLWQIDTAFAFVGYLKVLAENASEGAVRKENSAGAARAGNRGLFAMVRKNGRYAHFPAGLAETCFAGSPVDFAAPRTQTAMRGHIKGCGYLFFPLIFRKI